MELFHAGGVADEMQLRLPVDLHLEVTFDGPPHAGAAHALLNGHLPHGPVGIPLDLFPDPLDGFLGPFGGGTALTRSDFGAASLLEPPNGVPDEVALDVEWFQDRLDLAGSLACFANDRIAELVGGLHHVFCLFTKSF